MHIKLFTIVLCISLFSLVACSFDSQTQQEKELDSINEDSTVEKDLDLDEPFVTTGYIVRKDELHILVMPEITKEELMGKKEEALEALLREKYEGKGVSFKIDNMEAIDEKAISALDVGQKVVIEHDMNGLSAPVYGGGVLDIKIEEE